MATLEKIIYNQDTGTEAIQKLDRNQRKINDDVKIINIDGFIQQLTSLASKDTALQQQIDALNTSIEKGKIITTKTISNDANNVTISGIYHIWASDTNSYTNFPINHPIGTFLVFNPVCFPIQFFCTYYGDMFWRCRGAGQDEWSVWQQIAPKKSQTTLTPMNGWVNTDYTHSKLTRIGDMVFLQANLKNGITAAYTQIFDIPEGYKPKDMHYLNCVQNTSGTRTPATLRLQFNGVLDLECTLTSGCRIDINTSWRVS